MAFAGADDQSVSGRAHFVLVPLMAQGHTIPMTDMARLLAEHGAQVSFITTPVNACRMAGFVNDVEAMGLEIHFVKLHFPATEFGLPDGCENIDMVQSRDLLKNFVDACAALREPTAAYLREQRPAPSCIISDMSHWRTGDIARELGIPRLTFSGFCGFSSLASLACTAAQQLIELGLGLEASRKPFIWVIKAGDKFPEVEEWLAEGFEERVKDRGMIIRGWAPQVMILWHQAIGGFMTHCGWNSTIEAISAGVPMITWPHFAEQFVNEKLVVDVLKTGVEIGVKRATQWRNEQKEIMVARDVVEMAVSKLMGEGEAANEMRIKSKGLRFEGLEGFGKGRFFL